MISAVTKEERDALFQEITMDKTRPCSACNKKLHHGSKATIIKNHKGKIKAYTCSDTCSRQITTGGKI